MSYWRFPKYVSVAEKRARAEKKIRQLKKKNPGIDPVIIEARTIAKTWWGKSWNENLERYADYRNRIERGRSYVRHRSVLDLQMGSGVTRSLVQGSASKPYAVKVHIEPLAKKKWREIIKASIGKLDSLQDLLEGRFPKELSHLFMEKGRGLFPSPDEIDFSCSCPDWASMCKHVAATLYGIGSRLDRDPALFFQLRQVNLDDLVSKAITDATGRLLQNSEETAQDIIADSDLGNVFGIDMDEMPDWGDTEPTQKPTRKKAVGKAKPPRSSNARSIPSAEREDTVLSAVYSVPEGARAPQVAQKTGFSPATVRQVMTRLLKNGKIRRIARGLYGQPVKPGKDHSKNASNQTFELISTYPDGVSFSVLKARSGYNEKKLRNIIFRLHKMGKIRRVGRGVYAASQGTIQNG